MPDIPGQIKKIKGQEKDDQFALKTKFMYDGNEWTVREKCGDANAQQRRCVSSVGDDSIIMLSSLIRDAYNGEIIITEWPDE